MTLHLRRCLPTMISLMLAGACVPGATPSPTSIPAATHASVASLTASPQPSPAPSSTPLATGTSAPAPLPTVENMKASVTADLLSCRYGPGPNYLFLYGLRKGANIVLIGRTDGDNWRWVYVAGRNKCWVNTDFLNIQGDWKSLPIVYPGMARLPVSPYYPPTSVLSVVRAKDRITVEWADIPLRAGDEEDAFMQRYIVEVWRCENGHILFEPLPTNELSVTFIDQPGCTVPSHGRIFVQEKHGFSGPTEIPWPPLK